MRLQMPVGERVAEMFTEVVNKIFTTCDQPVSYIELL